MPLGGLFPEQLANQERIVISNEFTTASSCQNVRDPFEGIFLRHSVGRDWHRETIAASLQRLGVKRFQAILIEVNVVLVCHFTEEIGELSVEVLYTAWICKMAIGKLP